MQNYQELIVKQREFFSTGHTKSLDFRIQSLQKLKDLITSHEQELLTALKADLNKSEFDAYITEIGILLEEIRFTMKHLKKWAKPRKVKSSLAQIGSKSMIYPEPYGVVLIISPWNYPFQLAVAPLIGAIAAGNCAVLKPSELTLATSELLGKMISNAFPPEYITVIQGGVETSQALLKERWDYIFFTGSVSVGKIVMEAAAKYLTPVTLELGGKSPCIVHRDANLRLAAKRIAWGKFINAGQTCVAPDYVYIHREVEKQFLTLLEKAIKELYTENVFKSGEFTRIVSEKHYNRLTHFIERSSIYLGGQYDSSTFTIEPTVLKDVSWEDDVMQEEIFGPILPLLTYDDPTELIQEIQQRPKPLALYVFSEKESFQHTILENISFGGGCINDTVYHLSSPYLPFGGVGESRVGAYHGKGSFDTFSHEKSILKQTTAVDLPFRYQNRKNGLKLLKRLIK
jgi:aldehyde dehydrogenase (NAD+)